MDEVIKKEQSILYFEDDQELSELFVRYLTKYGYQVIHFREFPPGGVPAIREKLVNEPDFVLMDANLPGADGIEICRILRDEYVDIHVPIVFVSGKMSDEDVLEAYDAGADDYLVKPIRLKELKIKLEHFTRQKEELLAQQEQTSGAQKMAFEAMTTSSELGQILRFYEESYLVKNLDELVKLLINAISNFSLKSSILVFGEPNRFYREDGQQKPLEEKTLIGFKDQQRIYSWRNRTFFNYKSFSVLIRDMPIDDEVRCGILRDQLCLLFNGVDSRIKALNIAKSNELKAITMKLAADTIANMVMEIESDNVELSQQFESIILRMEADIGSDILIFNLLEEEGRC